MRMEKLGALGAVGGAFVALLLYVVIAWSATPPGRTGGIDQINATVTWIACAVPAIAIIAVHLAFAKVLWSAGSGKRYTI
jgi:hypothetical protein